MKKFYPILVLLLGISFTSCRQASDGPQLEALTEQIISLEQALAEKKAAVPAKNTLVHLVYFKIKEDANAAQLIKEIKTLEAIDVVKNLQVGTFKNLGDQRAMSEFGVMMEMEFANEADYQNYQAHTLHLQLKENAGPLLSGPPVTYDYITH